MFGGSYFGQSPFGSTPVTASGTADAGVVVASPVAVTVTPRAATGSIATNAPATVASPVAVTVTPQAATAAASASVTVGSPATITVAPYAAVGVVTTSTTVASPVALTVTPQAATATASTTTTVASPVALTVTPYAAVGAAATPATVGSPVAVTLTPRAATATANTSVTVASPVAITVTPQAAVGAATSTVVTVSSPVAITVTPQTAVGASGASSTNNHATSSGFYHNRVTGCAFAGDSFVDYIDGAGGTIPFNGGYIYAGQGGNGFLYNFVGTIGSHCDKILASRVPDVLFIIGGWNDSAAGRGVDTNITDVTDAMLALETKYTTLGSQVVWVIQSSNIFFAAQYANNLLLQAWIRTRDNVGTTRVMETVPYVRDLGFVSSDAHPNTTAAGAYNAMIGRGMGLALGTASGTASGNSGITVTVASPAAVTVTPQAATATANASVTVASPVAITVTPYAAVGSTPASGDAPVTVGSPVAVTVTPLAATVTATASTTVGSPVAITVTPRAATVTATTTTTVASPARLTVAAYGQHLWFGSDRTGNFEIYGSQFDGAGAVQLTNNATYNSWWPRVSPDLGTIIFYRAAAAADPHEDYDNCALWAMNADGSNQRVLRAAGTDGWALQGHAEWSPDGTQIIMGGGTNASEPQLWTTDANGANATLYLSHSNYCIDPSWSTDGSRVWFVSVPNISDPVTAQDIWSKDGAAAPVQRSTTTGRPSWDPYESPDGTKLAWLEFHTAPAGGHTSGDWDIMVADIGPTGALTGQRRLNPADTNITSLPQWTADSRAVTTHRYDYSSPGFELVRIDVASGAITVLAAANSASAEEYATTEVVVAATVTANASVAVASPVAITVTPYAAVGAVTSPASVTVASPVAVTVTPQTAVGAFVAHAPVTVGSPVAVTVTPQAGIGGFTGQSAVAVPSPVAVTVTPQAATATAGASYTVSAGVAITVASQSTTVAATTSAAIADPVTITVTPSAASGNDGQMPTFYDARSGKRSSSSMSGRRQSNTPSGRRPSHQT